MIQFYYTIKNLVLFFLRFLFRKCKRIEPISEDRILRILGNGQSLSDSALNSDKSTDYMVVNRHVLSDNYNELKPKYYVLADPHFFSHPEGIDVMYRIMSETNWNMTLFLPNSKMVRTLIKGGVLNVPDNISIYYYNGINFEGYKKIEYFLYDHQMAMPIVQNVMVAAIMLGIFMHFSKVELYGVEHSWTKYLSVGDDNLVYLENPHFFDKENVKPKAFKDIQHREEYPMWQVLDNYMNMFRSYCVIRDYVKTCHPEISIVNKTPGSFIDAFEREL